MTITVRCGIIALGRELYIKGVDEMDLLSEYTETMTEDYVGAEILGKKIRIKVTEQGVYVYDVDNLLEGCTREYIPLCIIRDDDPKGLPQTYNGRLSKRGYRLYFIDTKQPNPHLSDGIPSWMKGITIDPPIHIPYQRVDSPTIVDSGWITTVTGGHGTTYVDGSTISGAYSGDTTSYIVVPPLNRNGNSYESTVLQARTLPNVVLDGNFPEVARPADQGVLDDFMNAMRSSRARRYGSSK